MAPRRKVHISIESRSDGKVQETELPFVVGVLGDFAGNRGKRPRSIAERKFIRVDRSNFDEVLARLSPGLSLSVENVLEGDGSRLALDLAFRELQDFEPKGVAEQVPALRELLRTRRNLRSLIDAIDRSAVLRAEIERRIAEKRSAPDVTSSPSEEEEP